MNKNLLLIINLIFLLPNAFGVPTKGISEVYESGSRVRSGISMGGIGAGSIEMRKDGQFYNWSIFNNYPLGTGPQFKLQTLPYKNSENSYLFFLVRYQVEGDSPKLKLLQLNNSIQEGAMEGLVYYYPWMKGVDKITYNACFPFVNMVFSDKEMPFTISLEAFSPFIPHDVKNSSLPGVFFNFKINSLTEKKVDVMLLGTLRNLVSYDKIEKAFESELISKSNYKFFIHKTTNTDTQSPTFGEMGLGAVGGDDISYYLGWEHKHPYYEKLLVSKKLENIDDTHNRNIKSEEGKIIGRLVGEDNDQRCFSSIAVSKELKSHSEFSTIFFFNWYFPNAYGAVNVSDKKTVNDRLHSPYTINLKPTKIIGHYYQNYFEKVYGVADYFVNQAAQLSQQTHQFTDDFYSSDLPSFVLNQVNSQLNTLVSSSVLTHNGSFAIREGLTPELSWGPNATLDVSLYGSPMLISLFPTLQQAMMKAHARLQTKDGEVNHGLGYDLDYNQNGTWGVYDRIDLVPNYIQMVLRDYFWTNDKEYLKEMWPGIKRGIEYVIAKKDLNGDQMPDMNGIMCSYDNFPMYGLSSYIQSQWITALKMASLAASDMKDTKSAEKYQKLAQKGTLLMEEKLWNGSYYDLSNDYTGSKGIDNGCLTDQLIGQWVADCSGLGVILNPERVKKALKTILNKSFIDQSFLRNCTWPQYPDLYPIHTSNLWVDQANTAWSGVELAFASLLIYQGLVDEGLGVIKAVDDRYREAGLYFDHQEFGGHYYRPLSAWAILNSMLGFSINRGVLNFDPKLKEEQFSLFFTTPSATAIFSKTSKDMNITVRTGELNFSGININNIKFMFKPKLFINGTVIIDAKVTITNQTLSIRIPNEMKLPTGTIIQFK